MYAILISSALAIYSLILVDFSYLYRELSVHNDLISSTQAFYAAEGGVEMALAYVGGQEVNSANIIFDQLSKDEEFKTNQGELVYSQGIESPLGEKELTLNSPLLVHAEVFKGFKGVEPLASRGFALREIPSESNFNELRFNFNQNEEASDIVMDIFAFPKEGGEINFLDFGSLKESPEENTVKRLTVNTRDTDHGGIDLKQTLALPTQIKSGSSPFKKQVVISGFKPTQNNYLVFFQTLDNEAIHFELSAFFQGREVALPGALQTIDVTASTPTKIFQRITFQRESEELLIPGLNFVHFSDQSIIK